MAFQSEQYYQIKYCGQNCTFAMHKPHVHGQNFYLNCMFAFANCVFMVKTVTLHGQNLPCVHKHVFMGNFRICKLNVMPITKTHILVLASFFHAHLFSA